MLRSKINYLKKPPFIISKCFKSSFIVKSKFHMPELQSEMVSWPVAKLVTKHFLDQNRINQTAVIDGFTLKELTFGNLHYLINSFADSLKDMGLKKGDVVGIASPNHLHFSTAYLGANLAGLVSSCANPMNSDYELEYQFNSVSAKLIICHPFCLEKVSQAISNNKVPIVVLDEDIPEKREELKSNGFLLFSELINSSPKPSKYNHDAELVKNFDPESISTIPFSSGTTGRSKGVMLTHKNLVSNIFQTMFFEGEYLKMNSDGSNGSLILPLPFFHIYGQTAGLLFSHYIGAKLIFMPQFDLKAFLELIQKFKIPRAYVVPPIVLALAKHPLVAQYDISSLKCLMSGAAPLGKDVQIACANRLNCIVKQAWGMTETSPTGTITPDNLIKTIEALNGTSGLLAPQTEGKMVDPQTGEDIPPTQLGELLLRGPQIMKGYLNNPEATSSTIRPDGWLHTGDIGYFDTEGWLYLTDRMKELIKYKGFQVPPAEIEAIIASIPMVKDVIVIPVLDEEAGEIPRAYVVKQDNCDVSIDEEYIINFVDSRVAHHKRLRGGVIFADSVPKSPSGKLLRRVQIEIDRAR